MGIFILKFHGIEISAHIIDIDDGDVPRMGPSSDTFDHVIAARDPVDPYL